MSEYELPTFDIDFALSQFSGNQALLTKILEKFIEQNSDFTEQLAVNLQKETAIDAKRLVHTLKGVAGNLGFQLLAAKCKEVEPRIEVAIQTQQLQDLIDEVDSALKVANEYCNPTQDTTELETAKPEIAEPDRVETESAQSNSTPDTASPSADTKDATDAKTQLIEVLSRNEFLSDAKLEQYVQPLKLSASDKEKLIEYIDDFDYKSAISMLK